METSFGDLAERVASREGLARFVDALRTDLRNRPKEWENVTLERFLGALAGWIGDMEGWAVNNSKPVPLVPDWALFAHMLHAASIYE